MAQIKTRLTLADFFLNAAISQYDLAKIEVEIDTTDQVGRLGRNCNDPIQLNTNATFETFNVDQLIAIECRKCLTSVTRLSDF